MAKTKHIKSKQNETEKIGNNYNTIYSVHILNMITDSLQSRKTIKKPKKSLEWSISEMVIKEI